MYNQPEKKIIRFDSRFMESGWGTDANGERHWSPNYYLLDIKHWYELPDRVRDEMISSCHCWTIGGLFYFEKESNRTMFILKWISYDGKSEADFKR